MSNLWFLSTVLLCLLFLGGCQSVTGQVVQTFEERAQSVTGNAHEPSTVLTLQDMVLKNGMLQSINVRVQNLGKKDVQFQVKISQDAVIIDKEFSFKGSDIALFSLPVEGKLRTGRYLLTIDVLSDGEKLTSYTQYFRMNLWNQF